MLECESCAGAKYLQRASDKEFIRDILKEKAEELSHIDEIKKTRILNILKNGL